MNCQKVQLYPYRPTKFKFQLTRHDKASYHQMYESCWSTRKPSEEPSTNPSKTTPISPKKTNQVLPNAELSLQPWLDSLFHDFVAIRKMHETYTLHGEKNYENDLLHRDFERWYQHNPQSNATNPDGIGRRLISRENWSTKKWTSENGRQTAWWVTNLQKNPIYIYIYTASEGVSKRWYRPLVRSTGIYFNISVLTTEIYYVVSKVEILACRFRINEVGIISFCFFEI